ncbi:zinc finger protein 182-like isoform X2 [Condylostylus longicornis]|uniref:zinc finger protein 182-like isoform X2 n=1 Tax=Condylostylus longicornis TaxID=2530218 RepID=UPI00244E19E7|nr:zinc finger protein 182-like isoform X2 [Condylostylus longicornis]
MASYCVAPGCRNYENMNESSGNELSFFPLPSNEHFRQYWLAFIGSTTQNTRSWKSWRLCSEHFIEYDFYTIEVSGVDGKRRLKKFLKEEAVPTIHCNSAHTILQTFLDDGNGYTGIGQPQTSNRGRPSKSKVEVKIPSAIGNSKPKTNLPAYTCDICGSTFKIKSSLTVHKRYHTGDRPYNCNYCPSKFRTRSLLTLHERTHTGEKPYNCKFCGKGYGAKSNLYVHERIHTGVKPYKCPYCDKLFNQRSSMVIHSRRHNIKEEQENFQQVTVVPQVFSCTKCNKEFSSAANLASHTSIHNET